jgi:3-hydroxyisobutyrate dehydrogenase-like beta-hydroxyacid dehydrogenase
MMIATTNVQTVAFIGLGRMGHPIAAHILKAGFPLVVWNRTPQKAESLIASGATLAKSPAEAVAGADVVVSSLMDDEAVFSIVTGKRGILSSLRRSAIHIGASTISPAASDKLERLHKEKNTHYIAGPVLGRPDAADAGRLMSFLAGDPTCIERARPVVTTYAPTIVVVGERPRAANVAKLFTNYVLAMSLDTIGQALALAEKSKLDPNIAIPMLSGFFAHPALKDYVTRIAERDFYPAGFDIAAGLKDVELMIGAGRDVKLKLTSAEAIRSKIRAAMKSGLRDVDWCSFTEVDRRPAGRAGQAVKKRTKRKN